MNLFSQVWYDQRGVIDLAIIRQEMIDFLRVGTTHEDGDALPPGLVLTLTQKTLVNPWQHYSCIADVATQIHTTLEQKWPAIVAETQNEELNVHTHAAAGTAARARM